MSTFDELHQYLHHQQACWRSHTFKYQLYVPTPSPSLHYQLCLSQCLLSLGNKNFYPEFHPYHCNWSTYPPILKHKSSSSVCLLESSTSSSGLLTAIARYLSRTSRTMMKLERCLRSRRMKFNHQVNGKCFRVKGAKQNIIATTQLNSTQSWIGLIFLI